MKKVLRFFDSFVKFSKTQDWRYKLIFQRQWADLEDWERLRAAYNVRWGRAAIDEWLDYFPSAHLPIDYIEEAEKRKAVSLQQINGDKRWGLEIGIRYFPSKEYFPPVFIQEFFLVAKEVNIRNLLWQRDKFKFLHLVEIVLSGHLDFFERKHKMMYRHWLFNNLEDMSLIKLYEERGISWADIATLKKDKNFEPLLKYGAQTDSKLINIRRKTTRYMRWQLLKLQREGQMLRKVGALPHFYIFNKWVLDLLTGKYKL